MTRFSGWWFGLLLVVGCPCIDLLNAEAVRAEFDVRARIDWLRTEIARHDELYFKKNAPEISDADYDALKRELTALTRAHADFGVTAMPMGDDRGGGFLSARHEVRMSGLSKAYDEGELASFCTKVERGVGDTDVLYVIEPKYDGLAISLVYEDGRLVRAVTRGNGAEGDDVTENVRTIPEAREELVSASDHVPRRVELRGEIYIDHAEFARLNADRSDTGEALFAHPRSVAAGTLKLHASDLVAERRLRLVVYGWGAWVPGPPPNSQREFHALVTRWGLPGVEPVTVARGGAEVAQLVNAMGGERTRWGFPSDGVVVKVDAVAKRTLLGEGDDAPEWAVAYKFPPERTTTRLRAVTWQVGRTGLVTPVAELEPVTIGGTTVARATLHNPGFLVRRDLRSGDFVYVEKAGEIIPTITGVDLSRRGADAVAFEAPTECPSCATVLVREEGGVAVRCPNAHCEAQVRRRIEHFASPSAVGITGMGPALIETLVNAKKLRSVADLYRLRSDDGVTARVLAEIERSRRAKLDRVIFGLGLPGVGRKSAATLANRYGSLAALAEAEVLNEEHRALITELLELGVTPEDEGPARGGSLAGKVLVLTGTLPGWTRAEATQVIEAAGGRLASSVSRKTDWLVAGKNAGAKLEEARRLGVPVIDEAVLRSLLEK